MQLPYFHKYYFLYFFLFGGWIIFVTSRAIEGIKANFDVTIAVFLEKKIEIKVTS